MKKKGVAILGLGVVGSGVYEIISTKRDYFKTTQKLDITVESILDNNKERLKSLGIDENLVASNIEEVVSNPSVDVVVECIGGVEPSKTFIIKALMSGKTVVTSNKELFAKCWAELEKVAKENNAGLFFEATCVGGVPIIRALTESMQGNKIQSIKGIINGTTNYILSKMSDEGCSYEVALKEAQRLGYAERNPEADVEGYDACYKLSILSSLAFNTKVNYKNVYRQGITDVNVTDINCGKKMGYEIKLLAIGKDTPKGLEVRVHPTFISKNSPLASVKDSFNAVNIVGDAVGDVMLYGRGAGSLPTASAMVSDVIFSLKHTDFTYANFNNSEEGEKNTKYVLDFYSKYYLRLIVKDTTGVLSKISGTFAKEGISINEVGQIDAQEGKSQIIVVTHACKESALTKTVNKLKNMDIVYGVEGCIRIED